MLLSWKPFFVVQINSWNTNNLDSALSLLTQIREWERENVVSANYGYYYTHKNVVDTEIRFEMDDYPQKIGKISYTYELL